ncbi:hypothetical protein E4T56_gene18148 [Termitomyces sp. T112]|nr:hypothetical protein E4T56_gene18148 [Termitomyces sp. T112]
MPIEWFNQLKCNNSPLLYDWIAFLLAFRKKFADPSLIQNADVKLDALKQTGSAHYYLTSFMKLTSHLDMTEQTKIMHFMKGLKPSVKDHLVNIVEQPTTLEAWKPLVISINTNLHQHEIKQCLEKGKKKSQINHSSTFHSPSHLTTPSVSTPITTASSSTSDVISMDVDALSASTPKPHVPDPVYGPKPKLTHITCCSPRHFRKYARNQAISCIWYTTNNELEIWINAISTSPPSDSNILNPLPPKPFPTTPSEMQDEIQKLIFKEFHAYLDIFDLVKVKKLPDHWPYDIAIDIEDGKTPPFGPIYSLSQDEHTALFNYIEEQLAKGFICHSTSPAASPILFVHCKTGNLQL